MDTNVPPMKADQSRSNLKLISTTDGVRISQACDRCRIKKIKCDGTRPCKNCRKTSFECKTSDQLSRRAFPRGYTENLERRLAELELENRALKHKIDHQDLSSTILKLEPPVLDYSTHSQGEGDGMHFTNNQPLSSEPPWKTGTHHTTQFNGIQINNPIDQIFNIDNNGLIIGNDNINFESQLNQLLSSLDYPVLKISNSHNFILDADQETDHARETYRTQRWDLSLTYNPIMREIDSPSSVCSMDDELPTDVYDFFIKLINNFRTVFNSRSEMDDAMLQFFLSHNTLIPILNYTQFMDAYESLHTLYPFMFTYHDATMNGFNLSNNRNYSIVNGHLITVIQIYAISLIVDPSLCLNLLLNHPSPKYSAASSNKDDYLKPSSIILSVFDFLPYLNVFDVSIDKLKTYQLFLYYSLITNNKKKSLVLSSLINAFIGVLGINLNCNNLFFNDLSLPVAEKRNRVTCFWVFKVLLKCFNLKFGFKPSLNTTVINPVTIDRYWQLTPEKLVALLQDGDVEQTMSDELFKTLLKPSVEFLNLMNIIIPSSFSPDYYQYLKQGKKKQEHHKDHFRTAKNLDWILNEDDGDGSDGNLNYNFHQFLTIDKNLCVWRDSLREKTLHFKPLTSKLGLKVLNEAVMSDLYHDLRGEKHEHISAEALVDYLSSGRPNAQTATHLIRIQLNFHYILIRSINYLNFIVDKELNFAYYVEISSISQEALNYFCLIFGHLKYSQELAERVDDPGLLPEDFLIRSLGFDVDDDGNVINDFSVKRRKRDHSSRKSRLQKSVIKIIPKSPFNAMLNGLGITVINLKKTILLQMVYLHICQLKHFKRGEFEAMQKIHKVLASSIELFVVAFINYRPSPSPLRTSQDDVFDELLNKTFPSDTPAGEADTGKVDIDWDDTSLDEDIKYLRIIKGIGKYSDQFLRMVES